MSNIGYFGKHQCYFWLDILISIVQEVTACLAALQTTFHSLSQMGLRTNVWL